MPTQEWKNAWLSAAICWQSIDDDDESAFWQAARIRESVGEAYETLYYTPVTLQDFSMILLDGFNAVLQ